MRIIARLDIKNEFLIKGVQLEGLRKIGSPNNYANKYYNDGIDEIIILDAVASYYDRNSLFNIIEDITRTVFVPITVGGGIRKISDIEMLLKSGADKVAINTMATRQPSFIKEASSIFGSQCIVGSVVAKKITDNWFAYVENGRENTQIDAIDWCKTLEDNGAGELMITSLDMDGTNRGFDIPLYSKCRELTSIPIICSGGAGSIENIIDLIQQVPIDAVSLGSSLHYSKLSIKEVKTSIANQFPDLELRL